MGCAREGRLLHEDLTGVVLEVFFTVYKELGHGFLESVYRNAMVIALRERGLGAEPESPIQVWFRGHQVGQFYADVLVSDAVVLELKAARVFDAAHEAQLLHYLRSTRKEVGLLLNFGTKPSFRRLVFANARKVSVHRV